MTQSPSNTPMPDPRPTHRLRARLYLGGRCPRCSYDLHKHTGVQCPECGYVLAAELIAGDPPRTLNTVLWLHRAVAAAAAIMLLSIGVRSIIAWLKRTPWPEFKAIVPILACIAIWTLFEWSNAYMPAKERKGIARVLLTLFSIIGVWTAWRWL